MGSLMGAGFCGTGLARLFFKFWAALGSLWLVQDPGRCAYWILMDVLLIPRDCGWAAAAFGCGLLVGCAMGVGGDRCLMILPSSLQWRLIVLLIRQNWDNSCM